SINVFLGSLLAERPHAVAASVTPGATASAAAGGPGSEGAVGTLPYGAAIATGGLAVGALLMRGGNHERTPARFDPPPPSRRRRHGFPCPRPAQSAAAAAGCPGAGGTAGQEGARRQGQSAERHVHQGRGRELAEVADRWRQRELSRRGPDRRQHHR